VSYWVNYSNPKQWSMLRNLRSTVQAVDQLSESPRDPRQTRMNCVVVESMTPTHAPSAIRGTLALRLIRISAPDTEMGS
jgi:hypothetical protein